jgi:adenine phosphoribosyltransferase
MFRPDPELIARLRTTIRDIPDFPKPGIVFKDITPVLLDPLLFTATTVALADAFRKERITHVVGIESRGFIFGAPVAQSLGASFVPMRKPGKLPYRTEREDYALEYGKDALEVHQDAMRGDSRALIVDDVLATGGTAAAAGRLADRLGVHVVACAFVIELGFLAGREKLQDRKIVSLVSY